MIVGLVGFIGSGKGTAGELLNELGFTSKSFAGPVKDVAASMFGWERALLEGDTDYSRNFRETPCPFWSKKMGKPFPLGMEKVVSPCPAPIITKLVRL